MGRLTRRELLQAGAGAGMGALALGSNSLVSQALARTPGKLSDIEHVIILIQENRSFDHYFGLLPGVRGYGDKTAERSTFEQPGYPAEGYGGVLLPFHATGSRPLGELCFPDITHSWVPQHESWNAGAMDGFVKAHLGFDGPTAGPATMAYYKREDIPYYYALAENFTVCDNYHCSVLGPTYPNRLYSMSGTLDPEGKNGGPLVETYDDFPFLEGRFNWTTMPEQLSAAGITWKVYTGSEIGYEDNMLWFFKNYMTNPALAERGLKPQYPADFVKDLRRDELPQVSWINASLAQDEHPGYDAAKVGEYIVENVLALLHMHDAWEKSVLFVTYDENGGFFDHVAPPVPDPGTKGEYLTVPDINDNWGEIAGPIGLGFRVPLLVLSPFSRGGFLCSETFDHTSLLRFLETRFGAEVPNLSQWRRETTGDLTGAFNFASPKDTMGKLPRIKLTKEEVAEGGCEATQAPLPVPPNSFPEQEEREWRRPSGP
jgi:phospholipase C